MDKSIQPLTTNDPWIDLEVSSIAKSSFAERDLTAIMHINENLLLEAQKESSRSGSKSSRSDSSSPKTPKSPVQTADWISYWSSRIETEPPKEWRFLHPNNPNADIEDKLIEKKQMRFAILTNCASFLLGMGIMYLCLRRYLRMRTPYFYSFD